MLNSLGLKEFDIPKEQLNKVPEFTARVTRLFKVAGKYIFFQTNNRTWPKSRHSCIELVTDNFNRYTCVSVHKETGVIESISYFGTEEIEEINLTRLINLPATYCNDLVGRFAEGQVKDLLEYVYYIAI